jgi:hypothetical protein
LSVSTNNKPSNTFTIILLTGLLTGTLDALGAIIWSHKIKAASIFKYIASGAFGKEALDGGNNMVWWGIFFHFIIAFAFTAVFYLYYPKFLSVLKNKYLVAIVFGLITWLVTNLIIVPLSEIGWRPYHHVLPVLIGMTILILAIGLPIVLIADKQYSKRGKL